MKELDNNLEGVNNSGQVHGKKNLNKIIGFWAKLMDKNAKFRIFCIVFLGGGLMNGEQIKNLDGVFSDLLERFLGRMDGVELNWTGTFFIKLMVL